MSVARFASALLASSVMGLASADVLDLPIFVKGGYKMVEFGVGTPAQTARLLFDTGSASAWMVDAECADTCTHINKGHRFGYNLTASSTGKKTGHDANIEYLGGTIIGPTVEDKFEAGGLKWDSKFIAANESTWSALAADGFMGLGFGSIQDGDATPIFESLMEEKLMDKPRFGIYYAAGEDDSSGDKAGKGVLTLGGSREDKYVDGDLISVSLISNNGDYDLWRTIIHSTTGTQNDKKCKTGKAEKQTEMGGMDIVFDTGASAITFPKSMIDSIYESIGMNYTAILKEITSLSAASSPRIGLLLSRLASSAVRRTSPSEVISSSALALPTATMPAGLLSKMVLRAMLLSAPCSCEIFTPSGITACSLALVDSWILSCLSVTSRRASKLVS
ncbi:hypothetical protein NXS19_005987 [Fusarium pseudograminearum]|nr:hypothetical protein NXS19_005987 [Fusarium pseudograminearum]